MRDATAETVLDHALDEATLALQTAILRIERIQAEADATGLLTVQGKQLLDARMETLRWLEHWYSRDSAERAQTAA